MTNVIQNIAHHFQFKKAEFPILILIITSNTCVQETNRTNNSNYYIMTEKYVIANLYTEHSITVSYLKNVISNLNADPHFNYFVRDFNYYVRESHRTLS